MSLGNWEDGGSVEAESEYLVGRAVQGAADYGELCSPRDGLLSLHSVALRKENFL